ncbi:tryptophan-rich antigen [Plasmodium ovale curtisi]|uniref:Tryptophan-rich antigen n=3 Tax=Plasmodium ovale TaxID=36330 RepID=A0A1A8WBD5_PLAOA|nr:tryptophan-rich antigen [Plasmodium ovale curtisi]
MDPIEEVPEDDYNPLTSFFKKFHVINSKISLPEVDPSSLVPYLYVTIFTLSAIALFLKRYPESIQNIKKKITQSSNEESFKEIAIEQGLIEKSEQLKKHAWNNWLVKLEIDWQYFNALLESEKKKCLEEKENDWHEWLKSIENKWMHYNKDMYIEYESNVFEESKAWNDKEWEEWIKTEGKRYMQMDWNKWIQENEIEWHEWILKQWIEWKDDKILTWILKDWRRDEFEYWEKLKSMTLAQPLLDRVQNNYTKWEKRVDKEKEQWKNWVNDKQDLYLNECAKWTKWKENKLETFNEWAEPFVNTWIKQKQWNIWNDERNKLKSEQESSTEK